MTDKEILAMQGTEFIYMFDDGDTIKAYIKKIDIKNYKITCWSFDLITDQNYELRADNKEEIAEGACCLFYEDFRQGIIKIIKEIKKGKIGVSFFNPNNDHFNGAFDGCPF